MERVYWRVYILESVYWRSVNWRSVYWRRVYWRICNETVYTLECIEECILKNGKWRVYTGEFVMKSVYWRMYNGECTFESEC